MLEHCESVKEPYVCVCVLHVCVRTCVGEVVCVRISVCVYLYHCIQLCPTTPGVKSTLIIPLPLFSFPAYISNHLLLNSEASFLKKELHYWFKPLIIAPRNINLYARHQTALSCSVFGNDSFHTVFYLYFSCVPSPRVGLCSTCWGSHLYLLPLVNLSSSSGVSSVISTTSSVTQARHSLGIMGNSPDSQLKCTTVYNVREKGGV